MAGWNPRILEDSKKDIGGSSTEGLEDQTRHWTLEGLMDSKHKMETDRLKAEGLRLHGFIRGNPSAWWPEGPADDGKRSSVTGRCMGIASCKEVGYREGV